MGLDGPGMQGLLEGFESGEFLTEMEREAFS
jgi:hypothetical protein